MEIHELVDTVQSKADLVSFLQALSQDLKTNPGEWENATLERYLEALAAWLADLSGYYRNRGIAEPASPSWKDIADMLVAAKIYE